MRVLGPLVGQVTMPPLPFDIAARIDRAIRTGETCGMPENALLALRQRAQAEIDQIMQTSATVDEALTRIRDLVSQFETEIETSCASVESADDGGKAPGLTAPQLIGLSSLAGAVGVGGGSLLVTKKPGVANVAAAVGGGVLGALGGWVARL